MGKATGNPMTPPPAPNGDGDYTVSPAMRHGLWWSLTHHTVIPADTPMPA